MPDKDAPSAPPSTTPSTGPSAPPSAAPARKPRGLSPNRVIGAVAVLGLAAFFVYVGADALAHPGRVVAESTSRRSPDTEEGAKLQGLVLCAVGLMGIAWAVSLLRKPKDEPSGGTKRPPQQ